MTTYISPTVAWGVNNVSMSNAVFKARATIVYDTIIAGGAGLVQTADTGQIDLATTTYNPVGNTDAGYHIFRFNDSLQGTDPIFVKVTYGTASTTGRFSAKFQVGQGTNGAGTLTGATSVQLQSGGGSTVAATGDGPCYACSIDGFFMAAVVVGGVNQLVPQIYFSIMRTKDNSSGAFDGVGHLLQVATGGSTTCMQTAFTRTASPSASNGASNHFCITPGNPASSALVNGDLQLYPHFYADPTVRQAWATFTVRGNEVGTTPTSFTASPFLSQARTCMFLGSSYAIVGTADSNSNFRIATIWE